MQYIDIFRMSKFSCNMKKSYFCHSYRPLRRMTARIGSEKRPAQEILRQFSHLEKFTGRHNTIVASQARRVQMCLSSVVYIL
jgi:hypothetical protein